MLRVKQQGCSWVGTGAIWHVALHLQLATAPVGDQALQWRERSHAFPAATLLCAAHPRAARWGAQARPPAAGGYPDGIACYRGLEIHVELAEAASFSRRSRAAKLAPSPSTVCHCMYVACCISFHFHFLSLPFLSFLFLSFAFLSCPVLSFPFLSFPFLALPCLALPCVPFRSVPFRSVPFRAVPCRAVPLRCVAFRFVSFRFVWFRFVSFRFVSCRVVSCRVVSCRVVSCRFVSFRFVSFHVISFHLINYSAYGVVKKVFALTKARCDENSGHDIGPKNRVRKPVQKAVALTVASPISYVLLPRVFSCRTMSFHVVSCVMSRCAL